MEEKESVKNSLDTLHCKTRKALLWMNLSHEPFVVLYALLPFILRKDLNASLLQISVLAALRPVLPVFSFYWSANLTHRRHQLRSNLIGAWVLARIPFLFVPWIDQVWYVIFCCAVYEFFNKSGIPALIEILKINIPKKARENTYTFYFVLSFLESILLGFFIGGILDLYPHAWQLLCCLTAIVGLSSLFLQMKVPIPQSTVSDLPPTPFKMRIFQPWKDAFSLMKRHSDFAKFQYGFMMGGFGLMLIAPSLSIFYVDKLQLAHSQLITGRSILMGVGIVLSSYFWRRALANRSIPNLTLHILLGFALFPFVLILATWHIQWFYVAFILYGIAQAGSHLLWNLSGTLFAKEEDSSQFSRVNILMLGLRGMIAPALGGLLCKLTGPIFVLTLGALCCLSGAWYMAFQAKKNLNPIH